MRKFIATVLILNGLIWFGLSNIAKADTKTEAIIGHVITQTIQGNEMDHAEIFANELNSLIHQFSLEMIDIIMKNDLSIEGINELEELFEVLSFGNNQDTISIDVTKIRGLSYYTGFLVETNLNFKVTNAKGKEINIGSVASGGRYDNLIARFKGADYKYMEVIGAESVIKNGGKVEFIDMVKGISTTNIITITTNINNTSILEFIILGKRQYHQSLVMQSPACSAFSEDLQRSAFSEVLSG